jgi:hypothetical protein
MYRRLVACAVAPAPSDFKALKSYLLRVGLTSAALLGEAGPSEFEGMQLCNQIVLSPAFVRRVLSLVMRPAQFKSLQLADLICETQRK